MMHYSCCNFINDIYEKNQHINMLFVIPRSEKINCYPPSVLSEYKNEMDEIGIFLTECCILGPDVKTNPTDLYDAYKKWCEDTGETVLKQRDFGVRLTERSLISKQSSGKRFRCGVGLLEKGNGST